MFMHFYVSFLVNISSFINRNLKLQPYIGNYQYNIPQILQPTGAHISQLKTIYEPIPTHIAGYDQ